MNRNELLTEWLAAKKTLDAAKKVEMDLRKMIVADETLFDPNKAEGTERYDLGNGYQLKCVKKTSYSMANSNGETFAALKALTLLGDASSRMAESLVKFAANLRVSEYKKLNDSERKIMDEVITTKPGAPTLELVEPKA